jgi:phosphoribosylformimino-5-aminoimidazole carboxamide ribotide isomerase/phosphoribosylanthranilate isomerase
LDDIRRLRRYTPLGVEGVVIGRALYDGAITLADALAVAQHDR